MANTIVKPKRRYTIIPQDVTTTETFVTLNLPIPEWILANEKEVILVVNKRAEGFYHDGVKRRLRFIFGKDVKVISIKDGDDFTRLI